MDRSVSQISRVGVAPGTRRSNAGLGRSIVSDDRQVSDLEKLLRGGKEAISLSF